MKRSPLMLLVAAVLGAAWVVILVRHWRTEPADNGEAAEVRVTPSSRITPGTASRPSDALGRELIAALQRILAAANVRENETVLRFRDDASMARFLARAADVGLTVVGRLDALRAVRVRFGDLRSVHKEILENAGDYAEVSGNFVFEVPSIPGPENRPAIAQVPFGNEALAFIGAAGDRSQWGQGVTIAVLDTGVAADPTFGAARLTALDVGLGASPGKGSSDGHGSAVASLAAGMAPDAPGVAPAARVLSIRVTDQSGTSDIFTISEAIVRAADAGAQVINVSLGGYGTNSTLGAAIDYALQRGAVIVAAAGNDQASQLAWPAADPRVVSVGAVDKAEQQVLFSNSGPQLQLSAPGYGVQTAWIDGDRVYVDGTSASAPFVSGAVAAVLSQNPGMTAVDAARLLTRTAADAGAPGADTAFGNGILNLGAAMNASNPAYADTAVASHYFDAAANEMDFVVQNRGSRTVTGMTLAITAGSSTRTYLVPSLTPGQTEVVKLAVDPAQLNLVGRITYVTKLTNPAGVIDQVPGNNQRGSVLTAPPKG